MVNATKNSTPRKIGPNVYVSTKASNAFIAVILRRRWVKVVGDEERAVVDRNGAGGIFLDIWVVCIYVFDWIK